MTSCWIGVDPGLDGALALLDEAGAILRLEDMPTSGAGKGKREIDCAGLAGFLRLAAGIRGGSTIPFALIEAVHSMPKQGVASSFKFGFTTGAVHGALAAVGIPYMTVTPQRWQKLMLDGHGKGDKNASLLVARRRWPEADLARVRDHGRAEAALIAEYGRLTSQPSVLGTG